MAFHARGSARIAIAATVLVGTGLFALPALAQTRAGTFLWKATQPGSPEFQLDLRLCARLAPDPVACLTNGVVAASFPQVFGITSGDVDGDGVQEIVMLTDEGVEILTLSFTPEGKFISTFGPGSQLGVGDVDGDGRGEIVTTFGNSIRAQSVSVQPPPFGSCAAELGCGPLNFDEIVSAPLTLPTGSLMTVGEFTGGLRLPGVVFGNGGQPAVGDRRADVATLVPSNPSDASTSGTLSTCVYRVVSGLTAACDPFASIPVPGPFPVTLAAGDLDSDALDELIVVRSTSVQIFATAYPNAQLVDRGTFDFGSAVGGVAAADIDADGVDELVVALVGSGGTTTDNRIRVYECQGSGGSLCTEDLIGARPVFAEGCSAGAAPLCLDAAVTNLPEGSITVGPFTRHAALVAAVEPGDLDVDGLYDVWEGSGIDLSRDGVSDLDLAALGASAFRKDVFVEMDFMACLPGDTCTFPHHHRPNDEVVAALVQTFDSAPVVNPNPINPFPLPLGRPGINFVADVDPLPGTINHQQGCTFTGPATPLGSCFDTIKAANFGTLAQLAIADPVQRQTTLAAKRLVYHYALWGHFLTGAAGGIVATAQAKFGGDDVFMGLGVISSIPSGGLLPNDPPVDPVRPQLNGTPNEQAGIFLHELGHDLRLTHGGDDDDIDCKPNYFSVMNNFWVANGIQPSPCTPPPGFPVASSTSRATSCRRSTRTPQAKR